MLRIILKIIIFFLAGIVGGIFADQILWPYFVERPLFYEYRLEKNPIYVTERKEITIQENTALTEAIGKVEKTIIGVKTQTEKGEILEGSGLAVTADGLMVTLADLVPQGSDFSFFAEGKQVSYQILKRDLKDNLALVKIGKDNLATVGFADLEKLKLGERVFLIGVVFDGKKTSQAINEGFVSSISEDSISTNIFEKDNLAGSPLFNIKSEVLGLNMLDSKDRIIAIPISKIKQFIGI